MHLILRAAAFLLLVTVFAHAAPKITGTCAYEFQNGESRVSIGLGKITNTGRGTTGTLNVQLWALAAPYQGGRISGHVLGSYKLDPLKPGNLYEGPKKVVACTQPTQRKAWHLCVTVSEYSGDAYVIRDYFNFARTVTLGIPPKLFTLSAPTRWQTDYRNNRIDISAAKISHTRAGKTGGLRLAVWATPQPYAGGAISGYQIGCAELKPLDAGYSYTDVKRREVLTAPPEGRYYVTIALMEFDGKAYVIREYSSGKATTDFPAPPPSAGR